MARAKIQLICETCGEEFEHIKFRNNRADADSYTEWAKENITECPDCYYKRKQEERMNLAQEKYNFPQFASGSEKQIAWAEKIRVDWMERVHERDCYAIQLVIAGHNFKNMTREETIKMLCSKPIHEAAYLALTCTDAKTIIDKRDIINNMYR